MFCKHKWSVLVEKLLPSAISSHPGIKVERCSADLLLKTHVVILACEKCGKIDKTVEKI